MIQNVSFFIFLISITLLIKLFPYFTIIIVMYFVFVIKLNFKKVLKQIKHLNFLKGLIFIIIFFLILHLFIKKKK